LPPQHLEPEFVLGGYRFAYPVDVVFTLLAGVVLYSAYKIHDNLAKISQTTLTLHWTKSEKLLLLKSAPQISYTLILELSPMISL